MYQCVVSLYAHIRNPPPTILKAMSESSSNETTVPAVIKRARMPLAPLSDMIAWFHRKVAAHKANSLRWAKDNRELRNLTDRLRRNVGPNGVRRAAPLTLEEKRERTAGYMRAYRAKAKARKEMLVRKVKQEDWEAWRAREEAKKQARRDRWAKRFPWKKKRS